MDVRHEITAEGAFWGRDARRFRAVWTSGRWSGQAYVELRPHSRSRTEVAVHLESPARFGRVVWDRKRLTRAARALAVALRADMNERAPRPAAKARAARKLA
jgi:hypothetical protein